SLFLYLHDIILLNHNVIPVMSFRVMNRLRREQSSLQNRERRAMSDSTQVPQATAKTTLLEQSKQRLWAFFQNKYVKKLTPILVPGALAAALLPVFGPVVAGTAAAVAIKNMLSLLHVEMSTDTIEKLLKPIYGKQMDENDLQEALTDTLNDLLPTDPKVNE